MGLTFSNPRPRVLPLLTLIVYHTLLDLSIVFLKKREVFLTSLCLTLDAQPLVGDCELFLVGKIVEEFNNLFSAAVGVNVLVGFLVGYGVVNQTHFLVPLSFFCD